MVSPFRRNFKVSADDERLVRSVVGQERMPGSILPDFEALLSYVRKTSLALTAKGQLPMKALMEINALLTQPVELGLRRPVQKSLPPVHGLYLLVRASGLTHAGTTGKKTSLLIDETLYDLWQQLSPIEKYGVLLETWLLRGNVEILGEERGWMGSSSDTLRKWTEFFMNVPEEGWDLTTNARDEAYFSYDPGWHNLGLLRLFGLIEVQDAPPIIGKGWHIERISRTPLGNALLKVLMKQAHADFDLYMRSMEDLSVTYGVVQNWLQPYWPAWQNNLFLQKTAFREGVHIFKVSLDKNIWRRIAISANDTLINLAYAITNSVEFDHDHLHMFSYPNRLGMLEQVNHPYIEEGPWTDNVKVGDVPLSIRGTMRFVFDFGDWWEFQVTLEKIDTEMSLKEAAIIESHGVAPDQYPSHDDDNDDDNDVFLVWLDDEEE